jgi:hypothetical protein
VSIDVHVRLDPVATLVDISAVEPSPLCPDPSREKWRRRGRACPGPPLFSLCSLHVTDRRGLASADPQHPVASTKPHKNARKAAVPGVARRTSPGPPHRELLDALAPDSLAYKSPLRAHDRTHPTPSNLPDTFSPSRSLLFDVACNAGEPLGVGSAAVLGRRWTNGRRELEEECCQSLFCPSPSSPASSTRLAVAVVFLAVRR